MFDLDQMDDWDRGLRELDAASPGGDREPATAAVTPRPAAPATCPFDAKARK
ncbi:hypothetical protein [Pseudaestuariivita atlantica]|uniref:hypothetical protein n=1 Tax=Pseudaestuariivita atlantica TaxID=1317121 RepID=UPI0013F41240|nr:hypothetical protein [Pseudaestuariivita atlantica]